MKNDQLASLREHDKMLVQIRKELYLDPGAYVDLIFVHREEGLGIETRCLGCEGELEIGKDRWWRCRECGYEFSTDEMQGLIDRYLEALNEMRLLTERKKQWGWVHWLLRFLRITR